MKRLLPPQPANPFNPGSLLVPEPHLCHIPADLTDGANPGQSAYWYSQGCFIGCPECDHVSGRRQTDLCGSGFVGQIPDNAISVNRNATRNSAYDIYRHNPWRAPGFAPVADACGLAGGTPWGPDVPEEGRYYNTSNAHHGMRGSELPELPTGTVWKAGGTAEVVWQVRFNHGGGYSYVLFCSSLPLPCSLSTDQSSRCVAKVSAIALLCDCGIKQGSPEGMHVHGLGG